MSDSVKARLDLDSSGFQQGLSKAAASLNNFSTGQLSHIKGALAGAFTVGAIGKMAADAVALGGRMDDLSKRTGVSAESLQRLEYAAKQNGTSVEALAGGMQKLAVARQKALENKDGPEADAFQKLGISIQEVASLSPEELFYKIADAVKNQGAATNNAADLTMVLGRSFGELIPMMTDGADGLRAMGAEAERLGIVLSDSTIKALDELGDRMDATRMQATAWAATVIKSISDAGALLGAASANPKGFIDSMLGRGTAEAMAFGDAFNAGASGPSSSKKPRGSSDVSDSKAEIKRRADEEAKSMEAQLREEKRADQQKADIEASNMEAQLRQEKAAMEREGQDAMARILQSGKIADIKAGAGINVSAPISDNLARIGGFVGGKGDPALRVQERSLRIQEELLKFLRDHPWAEEAPATPDMQNEE